MINYDESLSLVLTWSAYVSPHNVFVLLRQDKEPSPQEVEHTKSSLNDYILLKVNVL